MMQINGDGSIVGLVAGGLPNATVTQDDLATPVVGNGPAFSAVLSPAQSVTTLTWTKANLNTEDFDVAGSFNNTGSTVGTAPAYSFNPQVAGYYQMSFAVGAGGSPSLCIAALYKNGSSYKQGGRIQVTATTAIGSVGSFLIYMNGSTDYLELYGYVTSTASPTFEGTNTYMTGFLARKA
jgi:hypothetical protein